MSKNVLVISTSLRKNSNSEQLATAFADGAREAGHNVVEISLRDKTLGFCRGCLACQKTLQCVIKDDANDIVEKMGKADGKQLGITMCLPLAGSQSKIN